MIKNYWRIILGVVLLIVGATLISLANNERDSELARQQVLQEEIESLRTELSLKELTVEDLVPEVEIITESGVHVRDMAKEMIDAQVILSSYYKNPEPLDSDIDQVELESAQTVYTRLTDSQDYPNTWMLNDTWMMTLDSLGTYADAKNVPIVFSMYMANGDLAGIVRGFYDADKDLISDIRVDYTVSGYADAVDPGGA